MLDGMVAVGLMTLVCDVGEQYGIERADLLAAAGLEPRHLDDPNALVAASAWHELLRVVLVRSGEPGLGLRLAHALDLRKQGFWGYALMSSQTLRERIGMHLRYQPLRMPAEISFRIEGELAIVDVALRDAPSDLVPVMMDCAIGGSCIQLRRRANNRPLGMQAWLTYREQPHHRELRELMGGPVVFDAPCNRFKFAARELDMPLAGDPHLTKLTTERLDAELAQLSAVQRREILDEVRHRLAERLEGDASLLRIACDLRVSARTLQRQLGALGTSFQELLEDVRRTRAIAYLTETDEAVERVAARLGYGDPSNFRRAFRRWTGAAPAAFRAEQRSRTS